MTCWTGNVGKNLVIIPPNLTEMTDTHAQTMGKTNNKSVRQLFRKHSVCEEKSSTKSKQEVKRRRQLLLGNHGAKLRQKYTFLTREAESY